jgi:hypothetical protein
MPESQYAHYKLVILAKAINARALATRHGCNGIVAWASTCENQQLP